ncbi:MAG: ECF transporter S component [Erysipelotrichaceae bacterium]
MNTNKLVKNSLLLGLLVVITISIVIPLPAGMGYINLSDAFIMLISVFTGLHSAMFIAGIGCMIADILLGYSQYALFTLIVKSLEAMVIVITIKKIKNPYLAFILGGITMIVGYGISDWILSGSLEYLSISMVANFPQALGCVIIATIGLPIFSKVIKRLK